MSDIPMGWTTATISDITEYLSRGKQPKYTNYSTLPVINQRVIRWAGIQNEHLKYVDPLQFDLWEPERFIQVGDILWNSTGTGTLGRACLVTEQDLEPPKVVDSHVTILRPNKAAIDPRYLFFWIQSSEVQENIVSFATGATNQIELSRAVIASMSIPIAPLSEQKYIVDKLDSLLARVDACRDRLERIPIILEDFRQSVITLAMSGKLTENPRKNEWGNVALKDICLSISDGDHQAPPQVKQGIPFITIRAINDKHLDLNRAKRFVPYSYFENLKDHQKPQLGDVLFSVTGSIAIPALVNTNESFVFQRHIAILKPDLSLVTSKFLFYLLCTAKIKNQAISVATGTAQKTIPLSKLRMFSANIPSIIEQQEIIRYIDTMLIYADRIEDSFKLAASHINCLTPSLLYKAYCGELVLQDPTDEPASVLLDRIRIMRETGELTFSKSQQRKPIFDKSSQSMIVMLKRKNIQSSHLSDILKANGSMGSEALWLASQLDIDDFYDQLKDEEENGLLKEQKVQSIDTPRFLESV